MKEPDSLFQKTISVESLFASWEQFRQGKRDRYDVQAFERNLERNIFDLNHDLKTEIYEHGTYHSFFINDPKVRHIRKANVRDRVVHQSVYNQLALIFEPKLFFHSYSCRIGKGTHLAVKNLNKMIRKGSHNLTHNIWGLKCDVRKFYDSVDHRLLLDILRQQIHDKQVLSLLTKVISSFHVEGLNGKGLPIGNLTSQIFTNIYLNELDQFIKHVLPAKYYLRYADDFILLNNNREILEIWLYQIKDFLAEQLNLQLHPQKIILRPITQGWDFLGYVVLPHHQVLRTRTKKRMLKKLNQRELSYYKGNISKESFLQTLSSYSGYLGHANSFKLRSTQIDSRYVL